MTDLHIALSTIQTAYGERLRREWDAARPRGRPRLWARLGAVAALALLLAAYVAITIVRPW